MKNAKEQPFTFCIFHFTLNKLFQFIHHVIYFFFCIVPAKGKPYRNLVGIVVNCPDNMAALLHPTGAGASAGSADIIYIQVEQQHL